MSKKRSLFVAVALILGASLVLIFQPRSVKNDKKALFAFTGADQLKQIEVKKEGKVFKISHHPDLMSWTLRGQDQTEFIIDPQKVVSILDFLNESFVVQRITKKPELYGQFEVGAEKAMQITLLKKDEKKIDVFVGKTKSGGDQFVRVAEDPYVYLISKSLYLSMDEPSWYYKKILQYPNENLRSIFYTVPEKKVIELLYDVSKDKLDFSGTPPEGKQVKDTAQIKNAFKDIVIKGFTKREGALKTEVVVSHSLLFNDGAQVDLNFLQTKEKDKKFYLDLSVSEKPSMSPYFSYLKGIVKDYLFELSSINESQYRKKYDEFFENVPPPSSPKAEEKKEEAVH